MEKALSAEASSGQTTNVDENLYLPLEFDHTKGEPFIRLSPPHTNIIITPPRTTDAEAITEILNDPGVCLTLSGPPYPYKREHAEQWLSLCVESSRKILKELGQSAKRNNADSTVNLRMVGGCPVRSLREKHADGRDTYLGDIEIRRCTYIGITDPDQKAALIKENEGKSAGDPNIIWEFGDYIATKYQGKGIMSAALKSIMGRWAIPRMNVRHVVVTAFSGNIGSVRVFEKNGFKVTKSANDLLELPESKGGGKVGLHILEWHYAEAT